MYILRFRVVRVGIIQNHIGNSVVSSNVPQERAATYDRVVKLIHAAGKIGVNILCLQEAWREFLHSRVAEEPLHKDYPA